MIRLGLPLAQQQALVAAYVANHGIRQVKVFAPVAFPLRLDLQVPVEAITYPEIILYRFFYRLLAEIDPETLVIFHGMLRTVKRQDLTYNCAHHYARQTPHRIVFEYLPFIEDPADSAILLDLDQPDRFKGRGYVGSLLAEADIQGIAQTFSLTTIDLPVSAAHVVAYEREKARLFDTLGDSDPDTVPRRLHLWAGKWKGDAIDSGQRYLARNGRFHRPNVTVYGQETAGAYMLLDFPHRRGVLNDALWRTGMHDLTFVHSGLKVDQYYADAFRAWADRLEAWYVSAGL